MNPFLTRLVLLLVSFGCVLTEADDSLPTRIDQLINAGAKGSVAKQTSDEEFLRRIYLDFAGRIPSAKEAHEFLNDPDPAKRSRVIDRLLSSPEYVRRMADLFHVMLMERLGDHPEWTKYLVSSFQANKSWDQMVKEMVHPDAESESLRGAAFFLSKRLENYGQNPVDYPGLVRDVGRLFLGVDLQCAQCHDHLFIDDYKQEDYQGLLAFLGHTTLRQDVKFPAVGENLLTKKVVFKSVFVQVEKMTGPRLPKGQEVEIPTFAKGEEYSTPPDKKSKTAGTPKFSPLQVLSEQLPNNQNALFKTNIANRLWWSLFGRGLVQPLDLQHSGNPPSHPALLDLLAEELASHHFDMKWLLRQIALSQTYQRSSLLPDGEGTLAEDQYRVFLEKPLSAEQLLVSVLQATGENASIAASGDFTPPKDLRERFLKTFANPPREPEGDHAPTLKGALFLMNDQAVLNLLKPAAGNLLDRLLHEPDSNKLAEHLYLSVLTRRPTAEETAEVIDYLAAHSSEREAAVERLAWSLLASTEFAVNH